MSAKLYVEVEVATNQNINVHRITSPWEEFGVTWNNFGGSYAPEVEGTFNASTVGWNYVDVTVLVGNWLDGTYPSYGLLLDQVDKTWPRTRYYTREYGAGNSSYLEIFYTVNGGPVVSDTTRNIGDTYIFEVTPLNNHGHANVMYTGWGYPSDLEKQSLVMFDIELTPPEDCEDCLGGVVELTLSFLGANTSNIEVYEGKKQKANKLLFSGTVEPAGTFTFGGIKTDDKMGKEISVWVDGERNTKIHTSCSRPIGPGLVSGAFEVIEGYSKNGGLLCPMPDCLECDGKVTTLTLQYNGSNNPAHVIVKQKKHNEVVYDNFVNPGETFTFVGTDKGTLGTEIKIYVDGDENTKIHTSCSKPIGPGLVKGDFEVIEGYSKKGGKLCPLPPQPDCGDCEGKVTELTMQYDGSGGYVTVEQKKHHEIVWQGNLTTGQQFTFTGTDKGTLGTEIKIFVDGSENAKIHTSCSKPIGPGLVKGDFLVISGYSKEGGELCPIPPPGWCDGKVKALLVEYTGQDCSFTNHSQDPNKVYCDGDPAFIGPVKIIASDKEDPNAHNAKIWFDGQVDLNSTFWIDATNAGENKLKAETHVFIYDLQDNLLQTLEFHTSCSQPLSAGDQFGSILMIDFIPE